MASPSQKTLWQTAWSIVGPKLPDAEIRLSPNVSIKPLTQESFERTKKFRPPAPSFSTSGNCFVAHYPPRHEVQSFYQLQIDVQAGSADEASQFARGIADRLLTSLSLIVTAGPYHAELRALRRANGDQEVSAWSQAGRVSSLSDPVNLERPDLDRTLKLMKAIETDETAENAYVHLLTAWQLQMTAGSKPLERSILQHYVLCMEAVVNGTMAKIRADRADRIRLDERAFAAEFAETLSDRGDKPKAIRDASTKLREIGLQNMLPSISEVTPLLGIAEKDAKLGKELYQFRSRGLSHPGKAKPEELAKWLKTGEHVWDICSADRVARTFFTAYCETVIRA